MDENIKDVMIFPNETAFMPSIQAAVMFSDSRDMFKTTSADLVTNPMGEKYGKVVRWGDDNDLPQLIIAKAEKSPDLSTGLLFNIQVGYGDGIVACRYQIDDKGKKTMVPVYDNEEINDFFERNDINGYLLEQLTDNKYFFNVFPEIILNQDVPESLKVVTLTSKEAAFSRWEEMDKETGKIGHHFYSAYWDENAKKDQVVATPVLDFKRPIQDAMVRIGREKDSKGKAKDEKQYRYIVPVTFPTPGRT